MLDKLKAAARRAWLAGKASIWAVLMLAFPHADDIVALIEHNMPALAKILPDNVYAAVGVLIVAVKLALQLVAVVRAFRAAGAAKVA